MSIETVIHDLVSDILKFTHRYEAEDKAETNFKQQRFYQEFDLIKTLQDFSFKIDLRELISSLVPNGSGNAT